MKAQSIKREAHAFMIWREGKSVGWECTYVELARATKLSTSTVRDICRERGWEPDNRPIISENMSHDAANRLHIPDVVGMIASNDQARGTNYDRRRRY